MPKVGIAAETWRSAEAMTGFTPTPALSGYFAEIVEVKAGQSDKDNNEYIMPMMQLAHDDLAEGQVKHGEYFALTEERIGFLKGFLEKIGRCDIMSEDAEWEDLAGTQFECDVTQSKAKSNGKIYANIDLATIKAVSHDFFEPLEEEPVQDTVNEMEPEPKPEPERVMDKKIKTEAKSNARTGASKTATRTTKAAPRRSPRSRVER